jgi:hypothetical protein
MSPRVEFSLSLCAVPPRMGEHRQPTELLEVSHRVDENSTGEHHERRTDDREEHGHVEALAQVIDGEGDHQSHHKAPYATHDDTATRRGEDDRRREHQGLETRAPHRLEGEQSEPPSGSPAERGLRLGLELGRQARRVPPHPERHVRRRHGGDEVRDGLEDRLRTRPRVGLDREVPRHAPRQHHRQGHRHCRDHVPEVLAPAQPIEPREQNGDDHRRPDALMQEDDERRHRKLGRLP